MDIRDWVTGSFCCGSPCCLLGKATHFQRLLRLRLPVELLCFSTCFHHRGWSLGWRSRWIRELEAALLAFSFAFGTSRGRVDICWQDSKKPKGSYLVCNGVSACYHGRANFTFWEIVVSELFYLECGVRWVPLHRTVTFHCQGVLEGVIVPMDSPESNKILNKNLPNKQQLKSLQTKANHLQYSLREKQNDFVTRRC